MTRGIGVRRSGWAVLTTVALVAVTLLVPAGSAQATPIGNNFAISVTGTSGNVYYSPRNSSIAVNQGWDGDDEAITVQVTTNGSPSYSFDFDTQEGSGGRLKTGFYRWAQRYDFQDPGRPGLALYGAAPSCDDDTGSFEVRDIQREGVEITRLWVVFERWCSSSQVDFGELRLGYPRTAYDVSPRVVVWPWTTVYPGQAASDVPIRVRRTSSQPVTVDATSVSGADAADFPIHRSTCTRDLTASGCVIWVGFTPSEPGPRHAWLKVRTSAGTTNVSLDGTGGLGTSQWMVDIHHADPSQPDEHLVMPDSASIGSPYEIRSQAWEPEPDGTSEPWNARFGTSGGLAMHKGATYAYSPNQNPFYMDLSRSDNGCEMSSGSVTLDDLGWIGPDRDLDRMDARLTATCSASSSWTVSARMQFHARADVTPPAAVTDLAAVRDGGRVGLSWTKPTAADLAGIIVRWYAGRRAPGVPWSGNAAYYGTGTSTSFAAPRTRPLTVAVWPYDTTGNVGARRVVALP